MTNILLLLGVFAAGMGLSVEAALLGPLGESIGHLSATLSIFVSGALIVTLALVFAPKRNLATVFAQPRWMLTGGILGPIYVLVMTIATPFIGVGMTMFGILLGQIAASLAIDHFGLLGATGRPVDGYRLGALALVLIALALLNGV